MRVLLILLLSLACGLSQAQSVPFDDPRWQIQGQQSQITIEDGQPVLMLHGGSAILGGIDALDGIIEFDLRFRNERGFSGAFWRARAGMNAEQFYMRPHQSGNPDANQYQPLFNGSASWQLYHGAGYAAPVQYRFDEWMRIKIVVQGVNAAFHIDSREPQLVTDRIRGDLISGGLGVYASGFAPAWFRDFSYQPLPEGFVLDVPKTDIPIPEHMIREWSLSTPFSWASVADHATVSADDLDTLQWQRVSSEDNGLLNVARHHVFSPETNAVFARVLIHSDSEQRIPMKLGYSDMSRVFINGNALFEGSNVYQSRDYRYLGTIGLFETVYLQLKAGQNELLVAVGENFGGWGLMAQLQEQGGISLSASPLR